MNNFICRICGNRGEKKSFIAKDNHFGLEDEFVYLECPECGTMQIETIPEDMSRYYPDGYYSKFSINSNPLKDFIKKQWYKSYTSKMNPFPLFLKLLLGDLPFNSWLNKINVKLDNAILDVGSGTGNLLYHLNLAGFKNLTGLDPYIDENIIYSEELRIIKGGIEDLAVKNLKFNLILFNYSFEHIANPLEILQNARQLQNAGDNIIIRIPVAASYAWKKYGSYWANLDAPRHFHIFTERAMRLLAAKSGYEIKEIVYDSTDFQFYLSELYKNNIPYTATKFGSKNPMKYFRHIVSKKDSKNFKKQAEELNLRKEGDQATFYLKAI